MSTLKNAKVRIAGHSADVVCVETHKVIARQSLKVDNAVSKLWAKAWKAGYTCVNVREGKIWL